MDGAELRSLLPDLAAVTASGQGVERSGGGARLIALRRLFARRSNQKIADLATHRV